MPTNVATVAYGFLILALFYLNRNHGTQISSALWIPVVWLSISASRMVSQWLGGVGSSYSGNEYIEGNSLDALSFAGLLVAGLLVLRTRGPRVRVLLRANGTLVVFFIYCVLSVMWSDYPLVAFKRWVKALGDLVMILVVLTDPTPAAAVKRLLARSGFVLIPLSVLFIKYYPGLGRGYSNWTGEAYNMGVATHKNSLGYICLIFGLGAFWYLLESFRGKDRARTAGPLIAHGVILAMVFWLFRMIGSATSLGCFLIGSAIMLVTSWWTPARKPPVVHLFVGSVLFIALYGLILNPGAGLVETAGRSSTLTGRTVLWDRLLSTNTQPWFGAGYESFWLGGRLEKIWESGTVEMGVNQAHNGYMQVFLDLGWVGVALLGLVMVWGYRGIVHALDQIPEMGRLKLAFFVVAAIYNLTEHAFRELHPVWMAFLLAVIREPETEDMVREESPVGIRINKRTDSFGESENVVEPKRG